MIMIDGVSADAFATHVNDLPNLHALAARGLQVERLASDVPATSLPGRVGMITGVPPARHGVYGNLILDGDRFRYASPDDVRVRTITGRALDAGLDVASIGYAMTRPEEVTTFQRAWWVGEVLQRSRDPVPLTASGGWERVFRHVDDGGRMPALAADGWPDGLLDPYAGDRLHYFVSELEGDRRNLRWSSALAVSAERPDLIVTEILTPDTVQHVTGYGAPFSVWAMAYADALVGTLLHELERAGRLDETNLLVASDHGHGPVDRALYGARILPNKACSSEGGILFVVADGEEDRREATERLAVHGAEPLDAHPFPDDVAERMLAFVAPPGTSFEAAAPEADPHAVAGPPAHRSTHGARPGAPSDDRFLVAAGPGVPKGRFERAAADAVEATLAELIGLPSGGNGSSVLRPPPSAPSHR